MKKQKLVEVDVCDHCRCEELPNGPKYWAAACKICETMLCKTCQTYPTIIPGYCYDELGYITACPQCTKIYDEKYRPRLEELEKQQGSLWEKFIAECVTARSQTTEESNAESNAEGN